MMLRLLLGAFGGYWVYNGIDLLATADCPLVSVWGGGRIIHFVCYENKPAFHSGLLMSQGVASAGQILLGLALIVFALWPLISRSLQIRAVVNSGDDRGGDRPTPAYRRPLRETSANSDHRAACWNCHKLVGVSLDTCPYCFAGLNSADRGPFRQERVIDQELPMHEESIDVTPVTPQTSPEDLPGVRCPQCGAQGQSDASFCSICGTRLQPTATPPKPAAQMNHRAWAIVGVLAVVGVITVTSLRDGTGTDSSAAKSADQTTATDAIPSTTTTETPSAVSEGGLRERPITPGRDHTTQTAPS